MKMPMDLTEVKLRRKDVFEGKIMTVHVDAVRLPNGEEATREVVDHVDGAAGRALEDATRPETILPPGKRQPAPGCYGETLHLFLAKGLKFSQQQLDPDEFLNVERVPFDEMVHRCVNGEIDDAKTVAAVLRAKVLLNL